MKKTLYVLIICALSAIAQAQTSTFTITGSGCAQINVRGKGVVGIQVTGGSWTGTIQPQVIAEDDPNGTAANVQVTPYSTTTAQNTITANGSFQAYVTGATFFQVCGNTVTNTATVKLTPAALAARGAAGVGGAPSGTAGGDLGSTYPNPTVVSVAHITTGVLPAANGGAAPVFSTPVTGTSMVTAGTNTVLVGPVTMTTPGADGTYRLVVQVLETAAGSGGTCTTGTVGANLAYKDADTGVSYSFNPATPNIVFYAVANTTVVGAPQMTTPSPGNNNNFTSVAREFRAASGTAIQYEIAQVTNSNCTTPPVFATRPALYYMGY